MKPGIEVPNMAKMSDLLNDISAGVRRFDFSKCVDFDWDVPLCWDQFIKPGDGDTFSFKGAGLIKSVLHRTYSDPTPAMYARSCWLSHFVVEGVTWIEDRGNTSPMISLAYTDRWLWHNASVMGGGRGLELGVGGTLQVNGRATQGVAGEFCISGRSEFTLADAEGFYAFGARNFTIGGRTSFERNGLKNGAPELSLEADRGARCGHGTIKGIAFESDQTKVGLRISAGHQAMKVGDNRHVLAGMDATCDDSDWYPNVVYADAPMTRAGARNCWIGRRQALVGPWYNRQLRDEPESAFDLRLPLDGSGT